MCAYMNALIFDSVVQGIVEEADHCQELAVAGYVQLPYHIHQGTQARALPRAFPSTETNKRTHTYTQIGTHML